MKKIMFNDKYGLTQAVLDGRKTMTRRIIPLVDTDREYLETAFDFDLRASVIIDDYSRYRVGEEVAVAQSYKSIEKEIRKQGLPLDVKDEYRKAKGWNNKMFVRADAMPHRIRITDIWVERLQDISEEDCIKEGVIQIEWKQYLEQDWDDFSPQAYRIHNLWTLPIFEEGFQDPWAEQRPGEYAAKSADVAFAVLIFKTMGKKTWYANPWVFAYEFELIK